MRTGETVLELAHGCVSCTLREDVLPLLRTLSRRPDVHRIVLHLDPALEPESVCWCIENIALDDDGSQYAADFVAVEAVIAVLNGATWLQDATGSVELADRGLAAGADDDRTIAQTVIGQAEFADVVLLAGPAPDAWTQVRTRAVLERLAPGVPIVPAGRFATGPALLAVIPRHSRHGDVDDHFGPMVRGEPPLQPDAGVSLTLFTDRRPFHPARLHDALQQLAGAVVRARGDVLWIASRPDLALRVEIAGANALVGLLGPWLATSDADAWERVDPARQAMAALDWDPYYGDRRAEIVVVSHELPAGEVSDVLRNALLTDAEMATGVDVWREYDDPFGDWHTEPHSGPDSDVPESNPQTAQQRREKA